MKGELISLIRAESGTKKKSETRIFFVPLSYHVDFGTKFLSTCYSNFRWILS